MNAANGEIEEQIFLQDSMDLNKLKMDNFGIFRTVTDDDFQHTPRGKRLLDLCHMIGEFTNKSSKS